MTNHYGQGTDRHVCGKAITMMSEGDDTLYAVVTWYLFQGSQVQVTTRLLSSLMTPVQSENLFVR